MNKEQIEVAKKIAEIEAINVTQLGNSLILTETAYLQYNGDVKYNPFNWSILGELTLKYEIGTSFVYGCIAIIYETKNGIKSVPVKSKTEIPMAMLKGIIELKGISL